MKDKDQKLIWEAFSQSASRGHQLLNEEMYDCMRDGLSYAECCAQYPEECEEDRNGRSETIKEDETFEGGVRRHKPTGEWEKLVDYLIQKGHEESEAKELADGFLKYRGNDADPEVSEESPARKAYNAGRTDKREGNKQKPALTTFGKYNDYYTRGYYGMDFEVPERSEEEDGETFAKAYGKDIAASYAKSPAAKRSLK